jgi:hypothetical protein
MNATRPSYHIPGKIEEDFITASSLLPELMICKHGQGNTGAAKALLAKTYLYQKNGMKHISLQRKLSFRNILVNGRTVMMVLYNNRLEKRRIQAQVSGYKYIWHRNQVNCPESILMSTVNRSQHIPEVRRHLIPHIRSKGCSAWRLMYQQVDY